MKPSERCKFPNASLLLFIFAGACSTHAPQSKNSHSIDESSSDNSTASVETPQNNPLQKRSKNEVAPGFSFRLSHPEDKQLRGTFRVEKNGWLRLPYQKSINTQGMNVGELESKIIEAFRPFFQKGPDVSAQLSDRKLWIDVQGPVGKPGPLLINEEASLDEVLAQCDGQGASAQIRYASVSQGNLRSEVFNIEQQHRVGTEAIRPQWRGAEVVVFSRESLSNIESTNSTPSIKILGEIKKPGDYALLNTRDFYHYLSQAEGYDVTADPENISLLRGKDHKRTMIQFNALVPASVPALQTGDVLFVPSTRPTKFEKNLGYGTQLATIVSSVVLIFVTVRSTK